MRSPDFSQKPTFHVATDYSKTYGPVAGAIAAAVGLTLDEIRIANTPASFEWTTGWPSTTEASGCTGGTAR